MKKNIVKKGLFMILNYKMQSINQANQKNVTGVKKQDTLIGSVKVALVYNYRVFLLLGHLEIT